MGTPLGPKYIPTWTLWDGFGRPSEWAASHSGGPHGQVSWPTDLQQPVPCNQHATRKGSSLSVQN